MPDADNRLATLFFQHRGRTIDKWEHYLGIYERELAPVLASRRPIRLLEIGVQNGGSLELWADYLPMGSEIIGLDIDPKVGDLRFKGSIEAHVTDATDQSKVAALLGARMFDVIVDDGSHISAQIVGAFKFLFDHLAFGGKYIIEDLHASYWPALGGGLRFGASAIEFLKNLIDALNADHLDRSDTLAEEIQRYAPYLARVAFYDSVAIVEKLAYEKTTPYRRVLSGDEAEVVDPFIGIIAEPAVRIGSLLLGNEQKYHVEAKMLEWLEEMRQRGALLETEIARTAAENARLLERVEALEARGVRLDGEARGAASSTPLLDRLEELELRNVLFGSEMARAAAENAQLKVQHAQAAAELRSRIEHLERLLRNVYQSTSWRLTGPLRRAVWFGGRALRAMRPS